ncbi:MAG: M48 family metalloprotease [Bacteroidales bacterium]|nr:M48 family metalloprotease [Bacteroidales bacterium]
MKTRIITTALFLCAATQIFAQQTINLNLDVRSTAKVPTTTIGKDNQFTITSVTCDMSNKSGYDYILGVQTIDGQSINIDLKKVSQMPIVCQAVSKDEYWSYRSIQKSLPNLSSMVNAYALRNKAETSANQAISALRNNSLTIEDPYLTSYINSLLVKINPSQRLDFFKYNFKVVIAKDDTPNAGIYPNGALVINAGMLARIHTEDELVALLCHEANHFICNHYLDNMARIQRRETAGAIGSALIGVAAGALTGSVGIGLSATSLSLNTASDINAIVTAMGLAFNKTQEIDSDQAAVDLLPLLGYDRDAMATCIKSVGDYYIEEGDLSAYYKSGSHPKIEDRIAATGCPYERHDAEFEKKMAPCVSFVAQQLYAKGRYNQTLEMVERNIANGVGRGMDYYIKGECLLAIYDSEETNTQALESLLKARETFTDGLATIKALVIVNLRLGNRTEAQNLLNEFITLVKDNEEEKLWAQGMLQNLPM